MNTKPSSAATRKGIVLAGGWGTRLYPLTAAASKQLLPVYDKPLVYYSISALMLADIRDILVISTPEDIDSYRRLLGDGRQWGLGISYAIQPEPRGIAESFLIGRDFIGEDPVTLVLGDNIFFGQGFQGVLRRIGRQREGATVLAYWVADPRRYGVIEIDKSKRPISIEEKPAAPRSNYVVTGLYFFDNRVVEHTRSITPSTRGELEITDLINRYLTAGELEVEVLGRGFTWFDTGTPDSLLEASNFVEAIQRRQGLKIACLEEIAWVKGYIDDEQLLQLASVNASDYAMYLRSLPDRGSFLSRTDTDMDTDTEGGLP